MRSGRRGAPVERARRPRQAEPRRSTSPTARVSTSSTSWPRRPTCSSPTSCRGSAAASHRRRRHPRPQPPHRLRARHGLRRARARRRRGRLRLPGFWARAGCAAASTPPDLRRHDRQPAPGLRRLDRRHDHRRWHRGALLHRERTGEARSSTCRCWPPGMWSMGQDRAVQLAGPVSEPVRRRRRCPSNPLIGPTSKTTVGTSRSRCSRGSLLAGVCAAIGPTGLVDDPRFTTDEELAENARPRPRSRRGAWSRAPRAEWRERLRD